MSYLRKFLVEAPPREPGRIRRRVISLQSLKPGNRPPKGFNLSGYSEPLILFYLNRLFVGSPQIELGTLSTLTGGLLIPFSSRNQDAAAGEVGFTSLTIGVSSDVTNDYQYDYNMHASGWLYSGVAVAIARHVSLAATATIQSLRFQLQHIRNNVLVRTIHDTGALIDGTTATHNLGLATKMPILEYMALNDVLRALISMRTTTNATGQATQQVVQNLGQQAANVQPHIYFHFQPTMEASQQALFGRRA